MRNPDQPHVSTVFSRADMGAMLDLKFETVSREISALVKNGAIVQIDNMGRVFEIKDQAQLRQA